MRLPEWICKLQCTNQPFVYLESNQVLPLVAGANRRCPPQGHTRIIYPEIGVQGVYARCIWDRLALCQIRIDRGSPWSHPHTTFVRFPAAFATRNHYPQATTVRGRLAESPCEHTRITRAMLLPLVQAPSHQYIKHERNTPPLHVPNATILPGITVHIVTIVWFDEGCTVSNLHIRLLLHMTAKSQPASADPQHTVLPYARIIATQVAVCINTPVSICLCNCIKQSRVPRVERGPPAVG